MHKNIIVRMPAEGCRDWLQGRCQRELRRNPGYHRSFDCKVIDRWSDKLDEFYDRAEVMGVVESDLADLWQKRFEEMLPEIRACDEFLMGDHPFECAHLFKLICIRALPICGGRCSHYCQPERGTAGQDTTSETNL